MPSPLLKQTCAHNCSNVFFNKRVLICPGKHAEQGLTKSFPAKKQNKNYWRREKMRRQSSHCCWKNDAHVTTSFCLPFFLACFLSFFLFFILCFFLLFYFFCHVTHFITKPTVGSLRDKGRHLELDSSKWLLPQSEIAEILKLLHTIAGNSGRQLLWFTTLTWKRKYINEAINVKIFR